MDFYLRSSFDIRNFSHRSFDFSPEELEEVLRTMPSLVYLSLDWFDDNEILQVLTYDPHCPFVPKLEYISIFGSGDRMDMNQFTQMVKSRWWPDAHTDAAPRGLSRLESVEVGTDFCEFESALEDPWKILREQGLEIIHAA